MFDVRELFDQVNRMKKEGGCAGNNFLTLAAMKDLSAREDSLLICGEESIALIYEDAGVTRLQFYLSSLEAAPALGEQLKAVPRRPVIVDCVGREERVEAVSQALCGAGFAPYTRLVRLRGGRIPYRPVPEGFARPARPEHTDKILDMLNGTFDPFVSHLPSREKLRSLIGEGLVYCVLKDGEIAAVECLERIGNHGIYIYQGVVEKKYRGLGFGGQLLQYSLNQYPDSLTFTTWVEEGNTGPIRKHQGNGMTFDGLRDAVLIYR